MAEAASRYPAPPYVIVAEKLMGIDPSAPEMTFLLVMLHTGTMFAVLFYFRRRWVETWRAGAGGRMGFAKNLAIATAVTGVVGLGLKKVIEKTMLGDVPHAEIEQLFGRLPLIAAALAAVGVVILVAGSRQERSGPLTGSSSRSPGRSRASAFRSRLLALGATISTRNALGVSKISPRSSASRWP